MKTTEEFSGEVYRRLKIRRQKAKRARICVFSVMLCLCAGLLCFSILSGREATQSVTKEQFSDQNVTEKQLPDQNVADNNLSGKTVDLMENISTEQFKGNELKDVEMDDAAIDAEMKLAVDLFQAASAQAPDRNFLISPLSVQLALAMTANGAEGETLAEMETAIGSGMSIETLNKYLQSYVRSLCSTEDLKLKIANSIWFRDDDLLKVRNDFLKLNAEYYGAQIYKAPFDDSTIEDMNDWVSDYTDGMIPEIVRELSDESKVRLINAITFDAAWQVPYMPKAIQDADFTNEEGSRTTVQMMYSSEETLLTDEQAIGFCKPYVGGRFCFAALLPDEGVDIYDYIKGLTPQRLRSIFTQRSTAMIDAGIPKFSYDFDINLNQTLQQLGMTTAFDEQAADFSRLGSFGGRSLWIGSVDHKTFISVDQNGTKASAATDVSLAGNAAPPVAIKKIYLDRPFVYMIVDSDTGLPIFIGAVTQL